MKLRLDGHSAVTAAELEAVARGAAEVTPGPDARAWLKRSRDVLEACVASGARIYGVTTGYGPLATTHVGPELSRQLQTNLVYHLATGVGPLLSAPQARAILAARLINLMRGCSAVRFEAVALIIDVLNRGEAPAIPSLGTVGASGDLTLLAHMALALMGEGEFLADGGGTRDAAAVLRGHGLEPLRLAEKEGLALVNGTSAMTGMAALNDVRARRLADWLLRLAVLFAEVMVGRSAAWSARVGEVRPHPGQLRVHERLAALTRGSRRLRSEPDARIHAQALSQGVALDQEILQDPYTLRCVPQIFGAVEDVLTFHGQIVETELNAVTDNPLFDPETGSVIHGGNFYGQHVAFASDALVNAITKLAIWAERALARVTDVTLNRGLPPFLQPRQPGLQSGFMGAQVTASALVAEMRQKAAPASVQSIPTNANNQDVVSMGTLGALKASQLLDRLSEVAAILALALAQAYELRDDAEGFSPHSASLVQQVRQRVPPLGDDRPMRRDIMALAHVLRERDPK